MGSSKLRDRWPSSKAGTTSPERASEPASDGDTSARQRGDAMTAIAVPASNQTAARAAPIMLEPRHWLAALAMLFVLFAPYQTLVQTVITDDEIRLGVEADSYDMIWVNVAYLVGCIYGLFTGTMWSVRIGKRDTLVIGLLIFCVGNVFCGAATGLFSLALGRCVEGFGKLMLMAVGRATLYKQFDRAVLVAIGFYGVWRIFDALLDASDQCLHRREFVMAVDVLGLRPGFVDRDRTRIVFLPARPAAATDADAIRLAGDHDLRGLADCNRIRILVVPPVGWVVFKRLCWLRRPLRGLTAGSGGLARVRLQSRRAFEACARISRVFLELDDPRAHAFIYGGRTDDHRRVLH